MPLTQDSILKIQYVIALGILGMAFTMGAFRKDTTKDIDVLKTTLARLENNQNVLNSIITTQAAHEVRISVLEEKKKEASLATRSDLVRRQSTDIGSAIPN